MHKGMVAIFSSTLVLLATIMPANAICIFGVGNTCESEKSKPQITWSQMNSVQQQLCDIERGSRDQFRKLAAAIKAEQNPIKKQDIQKQLQEARLNYFKELATFLETTYGTSGLKAYQKPFEGFRGKIVEFGSDSSGDVDLAIQLDCPIILRAKFLDKSNTRGLLREELRERSDLNQFKPVLSQLAVGNVVKFSGDIIYTGWGEELRSTNEYASHRVLLKSLSRE